MKCADCNSELSKETNFSWDLSFQLCKEDYHKRIDAYDGPIVTKRDKEFKVKKKRKVRK